jgi:hypothetical protein
MRVRIMSRLSKKPRCGLVKERGVLVEFEGVNADADSARRLPSDENITAKIVRAAGSKRGFIVWLSICPIRLINYRP